MSHTSGAAHLAKIYGTEDDKVNCHFFFKIGACRHGDTCQRKHYRPPFSQTILIKHMWYNPMIPVVNSGGDIRLMDKARLQDDFNIFYEEIYEEMRKFGKVEDIQVLENLGNHMIGNVYVKFSDEEEADVALKTLHGRFYAGRQLECEFSSVTDFRDSRCRSFDQDFCNREVWCNFMHVREPSKSLREYLRKTYNYSGGRARGRASMAEVNRGDGGGRGGGRGRGGGGGRRGDGRHYGGGSDDSRSRSRDRDRRGGRDRRDRSRSRSRSRDRGRDRSRDRGRDRR